MPTGLEIPPWVGAFLGLMVFLRIAAWAIPCLIYHSWRLRKSS